MPTTDQIAVESLRLDLNNFRTVSQRDEFRALHAMISIKPEWFWALTESLLDDGYHQTENIIVLRERGAGAEMIVKEGNRRIGALKLILGIISRRNLGIPSHIETKISKLTGEWKAENTKVPCAIYETDETALVDRVIALTHGKGARAGRDMWNAVAKARHNRDKNCGSEPALDLLEKYLDKGKNLESQQRERWSGDYPLSVLEEAIKRIASRFGKSASRELADCYPRIVHRVALEAIIRDIGLETLDFKKIRDTSNDFDFAEKMYGIPCPKPCDELSSSGTTHGTPANARSMGGETMRDDTTKPQESNSKSGKTKAVAGNDPKYVIQTLKAFTPMGRNREKLAILKKEAVSLKLDKQPHAFCFLLRSMFEISAKAYCEDHKGSEGPTATKSDGSDKYLAEFLRDISKHLTRRGEDKALEKKLHGAMAVISAKDSFLSVTSMNQLIHNPHFLVDETHISTLFCNIYPLLEEMNR